MSPPAKKTVCPCFGAPAAAGPSCKDPAAYRMRFVLPLTLHPDLANIRSTNQFILERIAAALHRWEPAAAFQGISDLAIGGMKISGNAQRRKRNALLFHGTILYAMQGDLVARYLKEPERKPDYGGDRPHGAFLSRIDAPPHEMKRAIADAWHAHVKLEAWPQSRMSYAIANVVARSLPHESDQLATPS